MGKYFKINELASKKEAPDCFSGAFVYFYSTKLSELVCHLEVIDFELVGYFWDLTCNFAGFREVTL